MRAINDEKKSLNPGGWEVHQIRHFSLNFELELKWAGMELKFEAKVGSLVIGNIVKFP